MLFETVLVLGGGGAKGAYEAGALRALRQTGLSSSIRAYSGTSIGALNCAFIQMKGYEETEEFWLYGNLEKIFFGNGINYIKIVDNIVKARNGQKSFEGLLPRKGLVDFLKLNGIEKLENMKSDFYVCVTDITDLPEDQRIIKPAVAWYEGRKIGRTEYFNLKNTSEEFIMDSLLATSALPVIYPPVEIKESYYVDGGLSDNLPINPLYQREFRKFIVVSTSRINKNSLVRRYPYSEIILIHPSRYLGNLINGTLNFNRSQLRNFFKLGHTDAMSAIKKSNWLNF